MAKNVSNRRFESVGWLFWGVTFALLSGVGIYLTLQRIAPGQPAAAAVPIGLLLAAIVAGVITVTVNSVLQYAAKRRRQTERRQAERKQAGRKKARK